LVTCDAGEGDKSGIYQETRSGAVNVSSLQQLKDSYWCVKLARFKVITNQRKTFSNQRRMYLKIW